MAPVQDGRRPIERARAAGWADVEALLQPHEQDYAEWKAMHPELAGTTREPPPRPPVELPSNLACAIQRMPHSNPAAPLQT